MLQTLILLLEYRSLLYVCCRDSTQRKNMLPWKTSSKRKFIRGSRKLEKSYCIARMHVKHYTTPASVEVTTELQAAASLFQVPVNIFQKPNDLRLWEWMVYKPQSKDRLDFSTYPRIAALKPPTNFNIEMLYNAAHFDVIASCIFTVYVYLTSFRC